MNVVTLRLDLRISQCQSSREKRRQLQAIAEKLHRHFNVSVAVSDRDTGPDDAILLASAVGTTRRDALEILERVADAVAVHPRAEIHHQAIKEV